jgi:hypothetical protein
VRATADKFNPGAGLLPYGTWAEAASFAAMDTDIMPAIVRILLHTVAAGCLFFAFQYFILASSLQSSLTWGLVGAVGAAALAWSQENRGR